MSKTKSRKPVERVGGLILPTDEEEAAIQKGIANDPDTFEFTDEQFKKARRGRPPMPEAEKKQQVTMLLDKDVISYFKKDGRGWQTRANEALRKAAGL